MGGGEVHVDGSQTRMSDIASGRLPSGMVRRSQGLVQLRQPAPRDHGDRRDRGVTARLPVSVPAPRGGSRGMVARGSHTDAGRSQSADCLVRARQSGRVRAGHHPGLQFGTAHRSRTPRSNSANSSLAFPPS